MFSRFGSLREDQKLGEMALNQDANQGLNYVENSSSDLYTNNKELESLRY